VSADLPGKGVEGHMTMRGCMVVSSMAGAGRWRLRKGLKMVVNNMAV